MGDDVRSALLRATGILAQHTGDHQHRLAEAYAPELVDLDLTGLPPTAVEKLQTLHDRLTYAGAPEITAKLLEDDEATRLLESIVELCMDVAEVSTADPGTYALGKCQSAVVILALGLDDLSGRLSKAVTNTVFALGTREAMPEELAPAFDQLLLRMSHNPPIGDEGTIDATTMRMPLDEAKATIADIVRLYGALIGIAARA